jgi:hypothetical protein
MNMDKCISRINKIKQNIKGKKNMKILIRLKIILDAANNLFSEIEKLV